MKSYFTIDELTWSTTATMNNINNTPPSFIKENLQKLIEFLNPLREAWGSPIIITSGYRSQKLNDLLNGSSTSAHCVGWAVDMVPQNGELDKFKEFVRDSLKDRDDYRDIYDKYKENPYSKVLVARGFMSNHLYITSNYRVLVEHNWLDDLKYLCEPTESHEKRVTVRIICSIGTSREFNRHRASSISEMSTRYCNFSKDKFGNEVTYILPNWMDEIQLGTHNSTKILIQADGFQEFSANNNQEICEIAFMSTLAQAEVNYNTLIRLGWKPQQAREVLPLATATEVVYTAFVSDWVHFFNLRCSEAAHPSARELAIPLKEEFIKRGYIKWRV